MFYGLTPLGVIHALISLVAVLAAVIEFARDKGINPANTRPGPISTNRSNPSRIRRSIDCCQRTACVTCWQSVARMASGPPCGDASTLAITGTRGWET